MVKILHLVSTFQIKTDTKWLIRLLSKIDRKRYQCIVGAFYNDGQARARLEEMGIRTFLLNCPNSYDIRVLPKLIKTIQRYSPDIIHTHLLRADLFGGIAGKLTHIPVISTVYAQGEYRRAKKRISDPIIDRIIAKLPTHFLAVCESIKDDLINRMKINSDKITVINTGIDFITIDKHKIANTRKKYSISENEKFILVPARLSYEKGIDCFLQAVAIIANRTPKNSVGFKIAGAGPMFTSLKNLASKLKISDKVEFLGFVSELESLMSLAYAIVIPSYSEGLPNVALEAFATGKPLIASNVGGIVDLYKYNPDAILLVEPKNPPDLADKILETLNNPKLAEAMSNAGKDIIEKHLSTDKVARRYEQLYSKIVKSPVARI